MKKGYLTLFFVVFVLQSVVAQQFVLTPQWTPQSQFAAFYVAQEKGLYKEAGLDVKIEHPSLSSTSIDRLKEGSCNIVTSELTNAIKLVDEGLNLVNLLQICNYSNSVIISHREITKEIAQQQGIKIGVHKYAIMSGIQNSSSEYDIEFIKYLDAVNLFVTNAVDAVYGKSYNELIKIKMSGSEIEKVTYMKDLGFNIPEDGIYVMEDFYKQYPEQCRTFAEVTKTAWEWVCDNIDESVEIVMKYVREDNIISNKNHQKAMLEEYLKSMKRENDEFYFILDENDFSKVCQILKQHDIIKSDLNFNKFVGEIL